MHSSLSQRRSLTTFGQHVHPHPHHRRHSHRPTSSAPFQGDPDPDQDDEINAVSEQSRLLSKKHDSPVHRKSDRDMDFPGTKSSSATSQGKARPHHGLSSSSGSVAPRSLSPFENSLLGSNFGVEAARRLQVPLERKGSYVVQRSSHRLERTPSIPAVLISRVKERIHEKMLQTSRWPNLVALVQERRQKAASEYLQSRQPITARRSWQVGRAGGMDVAWEEIPLGEAIALAVPGDRRRMRMKSDPVPEAVASVVRQRQEAKAMEARRAFRRRSISDETVVRDDSGGDVSPAEEADGEDGTPERSPVSVSPSSGGGIICSREDFQAILMDHRKRASDPLNRAAEFVRSPTSGRWLEAGFNDGGMVHSRSAQSVIGHPQNEFTLNCHRKVSVCVVKDNNAKPVISFTSSPTTCLTIEPDATPQQDLTETAQVAVCVAEEQTIPEPPEAVPAVEATSPETSSGKVDQIGDDLTTEFDPEILGEAIQVHLERTISRKMKERKDKQPRGSHVEEADNTGDMLLLGSSEKKRLSCKAGSICRREQRPPADGNSSILRLLCSFVRKRPAERAS